MLSRKWAPYWSIACLLGAIVGLLFLLNGNSFADHPNDDAKNGTIIIAISAIPMILAIISYFRKDPP
jgi:hypothetical protein